MGKQKQTRKFAQVKRMLNPKDSRLQINQKSKPIHKHQPAPKPEVSSLNSLKIKTMEKQKVGLYF